MSDIDRRKFTQQVLAGTAGLYGSLMAGRGMSQSKRRPNILFICSDQHSYKYAGYAGHPVVQTPNLDRIAREGVVFNNAYCGAPVCVAGRASLMTGAYASDVNSFCNSTVWDGSHPIWATLLRDQAGYTTWATGKFDLSDKRDLGFDIQVETSNSHEGNPDLPSLFRRPPVFRFKRRDEVNGSTRERPHEDKDRAGHTLEFIRQNNDKPWLAYVGMTQPHPPHRALQTYYDMYPTDNIPLPNIPAGHLEELHLVYQEYRHYRNIATPIPGDRIRAAHAGYYGQITEMDAYIGKIYDHLKQTGELENTLFIYTSDHGDAMGDHGLWSKCNLYEGAAHIPLIMAGAGMPQGKRIDTAVAQVDLAATFFELTGIERPDYLRGHSLLPLIRGETGDHPGWAFSECHQQGNMTGSFMIRKGEWKYIHFSYFDDLLFNLKTDPGEFNNLANDPLYRDQKEELKNLLFSQLDPEEVTERAFATQDAFLQNLVNQCTQEELFERLRGRLGDAQALLLAKKLKKG
ncbi:sulfatase-like hydrolase/transferase [candidate division KSB1 bacterium]|nr:sulfatase-like hydrolase/transferase [candidate division KSB1 bacterium]